MYATAQSEQDSFLSPFDIIVMAASAGGIPAIIAVLDGLPAYLPVPIVIVQHLGSSLRYTSRLAEILDRRSALPVKWAWKGDRLQSGTVYCAPQDQQVIVGAEKRFYFTSRVKINGFCPSADSLFGSVGVGFRERGIGVVLTGYGSDGALGAACIKNFGGRLIVQDEASSRIFGMPAATLKLTNVDLVLPIELIPRALVALTMAPGAATLFHARAGVSTRQSEFVNRRP